MSEDFWFFVIVVTALFSGALLGVAGCHEVEETNRAAIKAGLVQKQITPGGSIGWSKP